jgi:hypothetical protein
MERLRELEVIASDAVLKTASSRFAPGIQDRVLKFLADQGAVAGVIQQYHQTGDLEASCLTYWDAMLEPDSLRVEDLASALLISFATSLAASLLIEGGKAAFPLLFRRLAKPDDLDASLAALAKLEQRRREHVQAILCLLHRKTVAASSSQLELQQKLSQVRGYVSNGGKLGDLPGAAAETVDLTPLESAVRGVILTEEQRESGFDPESLPTVSQTVLKGLPLSSYFGVGQIVQTRLDALSSGRIYETAYSNVEDFRRDIDLPLRETHKHAHLRSYLGRPPKKVVPVADYDLSRLLDHPRTFLRCRPLIGALVVARGGMTCHTAVLSRGMGIPCIQLNQNELSKLLDWQFGAIHNGTAMLWQTPPTNLHQFL